MKILLFTNSYLPQLGGVEIAVYNIARHLVEKGHKIEIIAGMDDLRLETKVEDGIYVHRMLLVLPRVLFKIGYKRLWQSCINCIIFPVLFPIVFLNIINKYRRFKPDIVNLHYIGNNSLYILLLRKIFKFPLVVNIHGNDIEGAVNRSKLAKILTVRTLKTADLVLSNSDYMIKEAEKIVPEIRSKAKVIGNGIEIERFKKSDSYSYKNRYILNIANFVYKKGHDTLIKAFALVKDTLSTTKLPDLLLVGNGPQLKKCKRLVQELSMDKNIKFLGRVDRRNIPSLLKGSEFFVHPARKEPFGIVILEAMASGKAVIATRVGGIPDLVRENENGILVEPDSIRELTNGIILFLEKPDLTKRLGERGKQMVEGFKWNKIIDKYLVFLNSAGSFKKSI